MYYDDFKSYNPESPDRSTVGYVAIDCYKVAEKLGMEPEIVHGRLYYHLERKYGYQQDDGSFVHLFALKVGSDYKAINFPLLSAVLAELEQSYYRFTVPLFISSLALLISVASYVQSNT